MQLIPENSGLFSGWNPCCAVPSLAASPPSPQTDRLPSPIRVAHSIYAPSTLPLNWAILKKEGIDLTLVNAGGADKVMTSLISGDAQIGFMGSEASIYVYQEGSDDPAVNFAS